LAVSGHYDFVAFLDDDDRWIPTHLEESLNLFRVDPKLDVVFSKVHTHDFTGKWSKEQYRVREGRMNKPKFLAAESLGMGRYVLSPAGMWHGIARNELGIHPSTVVVRQNAVARTPWFDPGMWFFEDLEFFLFLSRQGCHFGFIDKAHVNVFYQGDNFSGGLLPLTSPKLARKYEFVVQFRQMVFEQCECSQDREAARRVLNKNAYLLGQCYAAQGQKEKARLSYWKAMKATPSWRVCKGYLGSLLPEPVGKILRELSVKRPGCYAEAMGMGSESAGTPF
jgi:hypothetical protein